MALGEGLTQHVSSRNQRQATHVRARTGTATSLPVRVSQKAPSFALWLPLPKLPGSAGILPASAGTGRREGTALSPDRRLGDACRLEGGAPGHGLLRHPRRERRCSWWRARHTAIGDVYI